MLLKSKEIQNNPDLTLRRQSLEGTRNRLKQGKLLLSLTDLISRAETLYQKTRNQMMKPSKPLNSEDLTYLYESSKKYS